MHANSHLFESVVLLERVLLRCIFYCHVYVETNNEQLVFGAGYPGRVRGPIPELFSSAPTSFSSLKAISLKLLSLPKP